MIRWETSIKKIVASQGSEQKVFYQLHGALKGYDSSDKHLFKSNPKVCQNVTIRSRTQSVKLQIRQKFLMVTIKLM